MQSSRHKSDITAQLQQFLELAKFFGFTTFAYDSAKRRVTYVKNRLRYFRLMLVGLQYSSCLVINIMLIAIYAYVVMVDTHTWQEQSTIYVLDLTIMLLYFLTEYLCFGLLAGSLLKVHRVILPVVNEMLKIFAVLRKKTDSTLFVPRCAKIAVTVRACALIYKFSFELFCNLLLSMILIGLIQIYGTLLTATALMGHLYSQLVLIGFYSKMTECLQDAGLGLSKEELSKNVQVLLRISFRIHRVKSQLNTLSSALFVTVFLGLSFGICVSYNTWKEIAFNDALGQHKMKVFVGISWLCINFFAIIYDLYLICWLSDELVARERRFMRSVLLLICGNKLSEGVQSSWEINQIMMRSEGFRLKSMIFQLIDLDKPFVLNYFFIMVVQYIIMCMQYYIKERHRSKALTELRVQVFTGTAESKDFPKTNGLL